MISFYNKYLSIRKLPVPIICSLNGNAIGAGFCLALACDFRIGLKNGKYSLNFVKIGIEGN